MITSLIPSPLLDLAVRALAVANRALYRGTAFECPVCGASLRAYLPLPGAFRAALDVAGRRFTERDFETLAVDHYQCPVCRAADRDRLLALFLAEIPRGEGRRATLLHFAPERSLSRYLRGSGAFDYRSADLFMRGVDERLDITRMDSRSSDSLDAFICSHVLEHVPDDRRAMRELLRILRPGGWGVIMAPILIGLDATSEDAAVTSPEERRRRFGQSDHVRVYAKRDFVGRLEEAGFEVEQLGASHFGADVLARAGVDARACLYVVRKPAGSRPPGERP